VLRRHLLVPAVLGALLAPVALVPSQALAASEPAVASAGPVDCPEVAPTAEVVDGLTGTGWTVERGTAAEPFAATVLGRIDDGIAPGVDMVMAQLDSPALARSGGVWAGMSGSPVHTDDGRLIGAVAYVLAANTTIAGITPAEAMLPLLDQGRGAAAAVPEPADSVALSPEQARVLAATGEVGYAQARTGFRLLEVPVHASGADGRWSATGLDGLADRLDLPGPIRTAGATAEAAGGATDDIAAGSNFAAALSYGAVTLAGVGTTTMVCDGVAVAFGHPLLGNGDTTLSAHGASAVLVQPDPLSGPFKVANPGGVVGTVTRDATTGIAGPLGQVPDSTTVTARFTSPAGTVRTGVSEVVLADVVADVSALQTQQTIDTAYGASSAGSASYTVQVSLRRADGRLQTVNRSDRVASRSAVTGLPVSYLVADAVYGLLSELTLQELEQITIESVSVTGTLSTRYDAYTLKSIDRRQLKPFAPLRSYTLLWPGRTLQLRVNVTQAGSTLVRSTIMDVPVPADARGGYGYLDVATGAEGAYLLPYRPPRTFDALLTQVRTRPGDATVTVVLTYQSTSGRTKQVVVTKLLKSSINPTSRSYELGFR
jgi:hypothetical protein